MYIVVIEFNYESDFSLDFILLTCGLIALMTVPN